MQLPISLLLVEAEELIAMSLMDFACHQLNKHGLS
jgi:hypothetical protein